MAELPVPAFFDPERVSEIFRVPYEERAREAARFRREREIPPSSADSFRVGLLLVDLQNTFCIPGFELYVGGRSGRGAVEDNVRLAEFLYRNLSRITRIHVTMDTHEAMQIFHPLFLVDEEGRHPAPMTPVSCQEVEAGRFRVNPEVAENVEDGDVERLDRYLLHYCRCLSRAGKYRLMVWPYHAMLGGIGHALVSSVEEAVFFHTIARQSQAAHEIKGRNPLTEHYSVLRPEVLEGIEGEPIASKNERLLDELLGYDALIIAGQAKSHCVSWTVSDLLEEIQARAPSLARKVYLLEDCSSPVVVEGVADFTDEADKAFRDFEAAGMHRVRSTEPIDRWPGFVDLQKLATSLDSKRGV